MEDIVCKMYHFDLKTYYQFHIWKFIIKLGKIPKYTTSIFCIWVYDMSTTYFSSKKDAPFLLQKMELKASCLWD